MSKLDNLIEKLCPDGVKFEELKEICMVSIGEFVHKNKQREDAKYPVFNGGISNTGFYDEYNNEGNKILISARGANAGFINKIESRYWAGNSCYSIDIKDKGSINWLYVYYYLKNNEKSLLGQQQTGSIPAISKKQIESFKIPVPPLEVQCEIVHVLDDFTLLSAELSVELKARKNQYNYYRDKEMLNAKNVVKYKLNEIAKIYDGTHQTPKYTDSGIDFISVENIKDIYNSKKYISVEDYNKYKIKPKLNDIFMTRIGTIGKCTVFNKQKDLAYYVSLALIRPNNDIVDSYYLKYLIESIIGIKELRKRTLVNAVPIKINKDDIGKLVLPIPPLEEQKRIVNILDRFDKLCNDISEGLPAEIEARQKQYEYYRDKLLTFKELKVNE